MEISNFELISLHWVYVGTLLLTLGFLFKGLFLSLRHRSNTPAPLGEFLPATPISKAVAMRTRNFDSDVPKSDRLRSFLRPALLPGRARRSVWKNYKMTN